MGKILVETAELPVNDSQWCIARLAYWERKIKQRIKKATAKKSSWFKVSDRNMASQMWQYSIRLILYSVLYYIFNYVFNIQLVCNIQHAF